MKMTAVVLMMPMTMMTMIYDDDDDDVDEDVDEDIVDDDDDDDAVDNDDCGARDLRGPRHPHARTTHERTHPRGRVSHGVQHGAVGGLAMCQSQDGLQVQIHVLHSTDATLCKAALPGCRNFVPSGAHCALDQCLCCEVKAS